ncbi:hypothetical protein N0V84_012334 [Fusarium piperis]|uniref:Decarboxylase DEC1 n=1 Tax=Fusarium piperis TaxID=1435070 RepID=A0A9W8TBQ4_9HYPO|nr:hypothetical protein N0V84_012334 [Fusarium piperis]
MPFGQASVNSSSIPQLDSPYNDLPAKFADVTILTVKYQTTYASISPLIPDVLEIEDEPMVTAHVLHYGKCHHGEFNEFIHTVEVKYQGENYHFCLSLIVDNEYALLAGREQSGFPKRLGSISLTDDADSNRATAYVERPVGTKLAEFEFAANAQRTPTPILDMSALSLRVIPSPLANAPPSIKELVPTTFEIRPTEVWEGPPLSLCGLGSWHNL